MARSRPGRCENCRGRYVRGKRRHSSDFKIEQPAAVLTGRFPYRTTSGFLMLVIEKNDVVRSDFQDVPNDNRGDRPPNCIFERLYNRGKE